MKEKLTKNLSLKLIAVFCGFFVWLAVVNIANPVKPGTQEVTVEITNVDVLNDSNMTYEIDGKKTATISYKVRTRDAYKIKASDFRAYADLSEMYDVTGAIPIKVEILNHEELFEGNPVVKAPGVIKIKTEALQTKRFDLTVRTTGTPAEGYALGETTLNPDFVYVKGPVSLVGQISQVGIEFDVDGVSNDLSGVATPMLYDANKNRLDLGDKVTILSNQVEYQMVMLKVKNLSLDFAVAGEVADGYRFTGVESSLKTVPVAGLKSVLASLNTLTIQDPALSVEGAVSDKECVLNLDQYLAPNISIVGMESHEIQVTLKVEALQKKTYKLKTGQIQIQNQSPDFDYNFDKEEIEVTVQGLQDDLNSLAADQLNATISVGGMGAGNHPGVLTFTMDEAYQVVNYSGLNLQVLEKAQDTGADIVGGETLPEEETTEENNASEE